ncbi:hypothetical protein BDFB_004376, partial [Asbolus verrucosus]
IVLQEFIINCDNAEKFAHNSQKDALLTFIISRLMGNPRAQLRDKEKRNNPRIALNRFIFHSSTDISRFLRRKDPKSVSEALNCALEEEKALQISNSRYNHYNNNKKPHFQKYCSYGHSINECFHKNKNSPSEFSYQVNRQVNFNKPSGSKSNHQKIRSQNPKFCRYYKKQGHEINECRKRIYNNNRK